MSFILIEKKITFQTKFTSWRWTWKLFKSQKLIHREPGYRNRSDRKKINYFIICIKNILYWNYIKYCTSLPFTQRRQNKSTCQCCGLSLLRPSSCERPTWNDDCFLYHRAILSDKWRYQRFNTSFIVHSSETSQWLSYRSTDNGR